LHISVLAHDIALLFGLIIFLHETMKSMKVGLTMDGDKPLDGWLLASLS
jgi:hypothetical protein